MTAPERIDTPETITESIRNSYPQQPPPLRVVEGQRECARAHEEHADPQPLSQEDTLTESDSVTGEMTGVEPRGIDANALWTWTRRALPVGDFRTQAPLPTRDQLVWHARHGDHIPDGWPRTLSIAWASTIGTFALAVASGVAFLLIHPLRLLLAALTTVLLLVIIANGGF